MVTSRGTAHTPIDVPWEEERSRSPLFFHHPVIISGGGGVGVDGGESARRLDELDKLVVVADNPLFAVRARDGRPKGERLTVFVKIEDGGGQIEGSGEVGASCGRERPACGGRAGVERGLRTR